MNDEVQQVFPPDADEAWERLTDDPEVRGVETARIDEIGGWQVTVWVMEFVRQDPLETEIRLHRRCAAGGRGVITADEQDREVWFVTGTPSGRELTGAAARVVDELADETRATWTAPARPSHRPSPKRHDRMRLPDAGCPAGWCRY